MAVMGSQFYEGGCGGHAGLVPADVTGQEERREDVRKRFQARFGAEAVRFREKLVELYGSQRGPTIGYAEAFQICEYGRQPSPEEIRRLFPFFPSRL
jgi:hypothetical protein